MLNLTSLTNLPRPDSSDRHRELTTRPIEKKPFSLQRSNTSQDRGCDNSKSAPRVQGIILIDHPEKALPYDDTSSARALFSGLTLWTNSSTSIPRTLAKPSL